MKILSIAPIQYRGIKVVNKNYETSRSEQDEYYELTQKALRELMDAADSVLIITAEEQKRRIEKELSEKYTKVHKDLKRRYPHKIQYPILYIQRRRSIKEESEERKRALRGVKDDYESIRRKEELMAKARELIQNRARQMDFQDAGIKDDELQYGVISEIDSIICAKSGKNQGFSQIAGYEYEKDVLDDVFVSRVQKESEGEEVEIPGSILFFGPYNNGKTYITKNVAQECRCNIIRMKKGAPNSPPEDFMKKLLSCAKEAQSHFEETKKRTIIFIDELDKIINTNSPIKAEFEDFIKTCSKKYHCSVFAATNFPSRLGLNMEDVDVFPIRMSIEPPDDENLNAVLKYYFDDIVEDNTDYSEVIKAIRKMEQEYQGRYNNSQIRNFALDIFEKNYGKPISQNNLVSYIIEETRPRLDTKDLEQFKREYREFIGEQDEN